MSNEILIGDKIKAFRETRKLTREQLAENSGLDSAVFVKNALSNEAFWGEDLTAYAGMEETVAMWLALIKADAKAAVKKVLGM